MNFKVFTAAMMIAFSLLFVACDKHDHDETEQENITRIIVQLKGTNGAIFDKEFTWKDANFDKVPDSIDTIAIPANTVFVAVIKVFDDTTSPVTDLSAEIKGESNDHLFVIKPSFNNLTVSDLNTDAAGKPFGIESRWTSITPSAGSVRIQLYHEPTDKSAANPGGEVDFDLSFPVKIK